MDIVTNKIVISTNRIFVISTSSKDIVTNNQLPIGLAGKNHATWEFILSPPIDRDITYLLSAMNRQVMRDGRWGKTWETLWGQQRKYVSMILYVKKV